MGALIRGIMKDLERDAFINNLVFDESMIPELVLLGELEHKDVPMDDGRLMTIDIIHYEGKQYVMNGECKSRWFGNYDDIK